MHTQKTAALSGAWDLVLDANGNLSILKGTAAICQNVCNEARLFTDDAYFAAERGIPWFSDQLARPVQEAVTISNLRNAALGVPGVERVDAVELEALDRETRVLKGKVTITTEDGNNARFEI